MSDKKQQEQNLGSGDGFFNQTQPKETNLPKNQTNCVRTVKKILISIPYQIIITLLTVYSLVGDDFRTIVFEKQHDISFDCINISLMVIFSLEIILSCIALENYLLSFFFLLDIISTLSLLFDITLFTEIIYLSSYTNNYTYSKMATQSKASRAAIRAIRVVKLFRIIRIVKLYKSALKAEEINEEKAKEQYIKQKLREKFDNLQVDESSKGNVFSNQDEQNIRGSIKPLENDNNRIFPEQIIQRKKSQKKTFKMTKKINLPPITEKVDQQRKLQRKSSNQQSDDFFNTKILEQMDSKQSKIRKILGEKTLKKIIIVILLLMLVIPLFDSELYIDQANSFDFALNNIKNILSVSSAQVPTSQVVSLINQVLEDHKNDQYYLLYFSSPFNELPKYKHDEFYDTRISDFVSSTVTLNTDEIMSLRPDLTMRTDLADSSEATSLLSMLNQQQFNIDQAYLSIGRTVFICILLILLLHFFNETVEELIVHPIEQMMQKLKKMAEDPEAASREQIDLNTLYETSIVSNAIIKIGALLSIVFGSAGAQIIGKNMVHQGDMNPMLEGKKKCAIFGFCDIRKFTQINEILEEDILKFVNKISSIVHKSVYRYGGSANKNIGEAFLLVWKIPDADYTINKENNQIAWNNTNYLSILADFSVYSFIKILVKINKSPEILQYRNDYRLLEKIPNYKVEMGFGLHIGWAIEGAIGSDYKIDASYLSPNVNMASRLEAATKQFGVNLLISESLYDLLTPGLQEYCRNIDRVTVKGSNKPLKLYTVDMNLENISPPADKVIKYPNIPYYQPDIELKRDINLQFLQAEDMQNYDAENFIKSKKQFREVLINAVPSEFKTRFDEGMKSYLAGKWSDAKLHFTYAQKIRSNDGPTKRLLEYMKNYQFVAPQTWKNYRQLTSK